MQTGSSTLSAWLGLARVYGHHVPEGVTEAIDHLAPEESWPQILTMLKGKDIGASADHARVLAALAELSQEVPPPALKAEGHAALAAARTRLLTSEGLKLLAVAIAEGKMDAPIVVLVVTVAALR